MTRSLTALAAGDGCPAFPPSVGTVCSSENRLCDYGGGDGGLTSCNPLAPAQYQCQNGHWATLNGLGCDAFCADVTAG